MICWDKMQGMTSEEKFKKIWEQEVTRENSEQMLNALGQMGFFDAPASTKYHGSYKGGLVEHSLNVLDRLLWIAEEEVRRNRELPYSVETMVIVALLHDVCKSQSYKPDGEGGFVYNTNDFPYGHGEKSVYMITAWMPLNDDEALAIRWHMGAYDNAARYDLRELSRAMKQCELVAMLHLADMMATHFDERA